MDGDKYHKSLAQRYQQLYKQVGQGHFSAEELAHNALRPLVKDIKGYGNEVIEFLGQVAQLIEDQLSLPILRQAMDQDAVKQEIEQIAQNINANLRGKNLAQNVCERYLNELDTSTAATKVHQVLVADYLMETYAANFESIAKTAPQTTKYGISHVAVLDDLPLIRPHVETYTQQIAEQIARSSSINRIKLPTSPRASEVVELDELLSF
jgi:hypothetical protein